MTRVISADSNNDIFVGPDGSLSISTGLSAVIQACEQAAKTQLGELLFATDKGVPNFDTVWSRAPNLGQFEAFLRRNLSAVPDVIAVDSVTIADSGGVLSYVAVIRTIYGPGVVNV